LPVLAAQIRELPLILECGRVRKCALYFPGPIELLFETIAETQEGSFAGASFPVAYF